MTRPPGRPPFGRGLLVAAVCAQVAISLLSQVDFFRQMLGFPSRLGAAGRPGAFSSLALVGALVAVCALWARKLGPRRPFGERFGTAGLVHLAAIGLAHTAAAFATGGRLFPWITWALVDGSALAALAWRAPREEDDAPAPRVPFCAWDALSALLLATLLVPTVFAYIHFDTAVIWGCRAFALEEQGNLRALLTCRHPSYPPLFSLLLWLGAGDPVFEGRLLPWLALVFFALLFRARAAALFGRTAPLAALFLLATVQVWQGEATYYANVPLMVFLAAGALLAWEVGASRARRAAGGLCLAAAILVRADAFAYVAVLAVAALVVRVREGRRVPLAPFGAPAVAFLAWSLRPPWLQLPDDFFAGADGGWRAYGAVRLLVTLANGLQGLWLAHKGFGAAVVLLVAALALRLRARRRGEETGLWGLVTLGSLGCVAAMYAAIPYLGNLWSAAQPFEGTWIEAYLHFVRVGAGRMTVHLYPFAVLYAFAAFAEEERAAEAEAPRAPLMEIMAWRRR